MAVAAIAAGITISKAQPVYSQNVVGYANVQTLNAGSFYAMACPFAIGVSNGANEVFGTNLPASSAIFTWDVPSQSLIETIFDNTQDPSILWYQGDDATPAQIPTLPAGQGFFLVPNNPITNLFSGAVAVNVGATNTMTLANAGSFYLVSSPVPFTGYITNQVALTNLSDSSAIFIWDVNSQSLAEFIYDTSQGNGINWYQGDDATPADCPTVGVGQGFFVVPNNPYVWKQKF